MIRRALVAGFGAVALSVALAGSAMAAQPNNQACLGHDFSTYAQSGAPGPILVTESGSGFGQFNASLAQAVPGLGLPIQTHLAGFIPDAYLVNSCND